MGEVGGVDDGVEGGLPVRNLPVPRFVDVRERPGVLEGSAGGLRSDGSAVVRVGVEGRVQVDQIDGTRCSCPA